MLSHFEYCILGYGAISSRLVDRLLASRNRVMVVTDRSQAFQITHAGSIEFVSRDFFLQNHRKLVFEVVICNLRLDLLDENEFLKLILAATIHDPRKFLLLSSGSVYGETQAPAIEEAPTIPISLYAKKRLEAESLVLNSLSDSVTVLNLRISNVFGHSSLKDFVNITLGRVLNSEELPLFDGGSLVRDYIHIDDLIEAICLMEGNFKSSFETFNISSGTPTSLKWLIELIQKIDARYRSEIRWIEKPADVLQNSLIDSSKAKIFLNWNPRSPNVALEDYCRLYFANNL